MSKSGVREDWIESTSDIRSTISPSLTSAVMTEEEEEEEEAEEEAAGTSPELPTKKLWQGRIRIVKNI